MEHRSGNTSPRNVVYATETEYTLYSPYPGNGSATNSFRLASIAISAFFSRAGNKEGEEKRKSNKKKEREGNRSLVRAIPFPSFDVVSISGRRFTTLPTTNTFLVSSRCHEHSRSRYWPPIEFQTSRQWRSNRGTWQKACRCV